MSIVEVWNILIFARPQRKKSKSRNESGQNEKIVETVFLSILNQMEIHLVQNRKEDCHHDHILFNVKGNGNKIFAAYECSAFNVK